MAESSLTGYVGPAFPVVIPVSRLGAGTPSEPASAVAVGEGGPAEAEAAMWKAGCASCELSLMWQALGDVVTTRLGAGRANCVRRLRLAADRISQAADLCEEEV